MLLALGPATVAEAGPVVRVATTDGISDLDVGGGRVFWTTWEAKSASVFSAGLATPRRRLLREPMWEGFDDVSPSVWASSQRVAVEIETYFAGVDEDYVEIAAQASGPVGGKALRPLPSMPRIGFERIQDVAEDSVLTRAVKRIRGRWTVRAYVYVRGRGKAQAVGPRLTLAQDETSFDIEGRLSRNWMALLREQRSRITVYDRRTGRPAWSVQLPRAGSLVWELADDGTLAVAQAISNGRGEATRAVLRWAPPRGAFRRLPGAALPHYPLTLRAGTLTYVAPGRKGRGRLYVRRAGGPARPLTGDLPPGPIGTDGPMIVTDGVMVAAAVQRRREATTCVFIATLPVARSESWRCPRRSANR
jgi:hypothetical protein